MSELKKSSVEKGFDPLKMMQEINQMKSRAEKKIDKP